SLVELLDDLVEGLLTEVRDREEVVVGLVEQLTDRVDLRALEAVAGTLGEVEVLDGQLQVGRTAGGGGHLSQLEAEGLVAHLLDELDELAEGRTRRRQRLTSRDRPVGLDVEEEPIELGGLLDAGGLDLEGHPADRRED